MKMFLHEGFRLGTNFPLHPSAMTQLASIFRSPAFRTPNVLGGRGSPSTTVLPSIGPVVIKTFRRGGLLGRLIEKTYLRIGKTRSQREFEELERVRKLGVRAPEPVAFAFRGRLFCQNWLVTRKIPSVRTIAELCEGELDRAISVLPSLGRQMQILIKNGILHADFHPGNVLVDSFDKVYLVDFDKASPYRGKRSALRSKYRRRWCRAVEKHRLPKRLSATIDTWLG